MKETSETTKGLDKHVQIGKVKKNLPKFDFSTPTKILMGCACLSLLLCCCVTFLMAGALALGTRDGCSLDDLINSPSKCITLTEEQKDQYDKYIEEEKDKEELVEPESSIYDGFKLYETENYSIQYPEKWILDKSSIVFFYSKDPKKLSFQINDNFNIIEQNLGSTEISNLECKIYANTVKENLGKSFEKVSLVEDKVVEVTAKLNACQLVFKNRLRGIDMNQVQYLIINPTANKPAVILTLTTGLDSKNVELMNQMAGSFEFKE